jgi:hypothetical protein
MEMNDFKDKNNIAKTLTASTAFLDMWLSFFRFFFVLKLFLCAC